MSLTINELTKKYPAASEYITQIYLILRDYFYCNNKRLAEHIGVSASAVSQAILRLKKLNFVEQDKYGMINLCVDGKLLAEELLKRHYLLEYLMVKKLQFPWELSDNEAEHLQDKVSPDFINHLDKYLDFPKTCPHGNPFPDNPDAAVILNAPRLTKAKPGEIVKIVRITEEGERIPGLLHTCFEIGVMPGMIYEISEVLDDTITLISKKTGELNSLSRDFAKYICVYLH